MSISDTRLKELLDYATNYGEFSETDAPTDIHKDSIKALKELDAKRRVEQLVKERLGVDIANLPPASDEPPSCTITMDARIKDGMCSLTINKRIPTELAVKIARLVEEEGGE